MKFAEDVTWLGAEYNEYNEDTGQINYGILFVNPERLGLLEAKWKTITLPDTVTHLKCGEVPGFGEIGVFMINDNLVSVNCGNGIIQEGRCAFEGCTSLETVKIRLSETVTENCYAYMFDGCTSLTEAPALPATTLASDCYECMFQGCTSLVTAPALPATALTDYCYYEMFNGCESLHKVKCFAIDMQADSCLYNWIDETNGGDIEAPEIWNTKYWDGHIIPNGWTINGQTPMRPD